MVRPYAVDTSATFGHRHDAPIIGAWAQAETPSGFSTPVVMDMSEKWTAKQTGNPHAVADGWAIIYDPTPNGKRNDDGTTTFSLRFPVLLLSEWVADPEKTAHEIADALNRAEAT